MGVWKRIKILLPDRLFSEFVRERANWRCQYNFKCYPNVSFRSNPGGLHCSHFQGRGKWSVRYDPENADAGCAACHNWITDTVEGKKALGAWKLKQLGQRAYNLLIIRANTPGKRDDKMSTLYVKVLMQELLESRKR